MDAKTIIDVVDALIGGDAEPVGDSAVDRYKLERQIKKEQLIEWLLKDIFNCYECKDVYWASGKVAGKRAEKFLSDLHDMIGEMLGKNEPES